jgi:hypothetical protein
MSTFVLLAAGVVAGSGTERVSAEVEQRLDLRGEWGTVIWEDSRGRRREVQDLGTIDLGPVVDEGRGQFRLRMDGEDHLGIYHWEADRLLLTFRPASQGRPSCYRVGEGQFLFILRRVPAKR